MIASPLPQATQKIKQKIYIAHGQLKLFHLKYF